MSYSSSGPKQVKSQKVGFSLFLLLNLLLKLSELLYFSWIQFSHVSEWERKGGVGINLSSTVCTSNLANTIWQIGFTICFNLDLLTAVSWSAVLRRILRRLSKSVSVDLGVSVMEKEVRSGSDSSIPGVFPSVILIPGIDICVLDQES